MVANKLEDPRNEIEYMFRNNFNFTSLFKDPDYFTSDFTKYDIWVEH